MIPPFSAAAAVRGRSAAAANIRGSTVGPFVS